MDLAFIITVEIILIVSLIVYEIRFRKQFCKRCGTRMDKYFDAEEDAEVYQCPMCGRSYLIK